MSKLSARVYREKMSGDHLFTTRCTWAKAIHIYK